MNMTQNDTRNNKLDIMIGSKIHTVFLQDGFYAPSAETPPFHKHNYAEIHIITGPNAYFNIGDTLFSASDGNLIIIPRGIFHRFVSKDKCTVHTAFQMDYDTNSFSSCNIKPDIIFEFLREIEKCKTSYDYTRISSYISLFCSYFCSKETQSAKPITDYGFLIHEFFTNHYHEDLRLRDLATALHLSERQAERLVIEYTGNTFRKELTSIRLNIAKHLRETTHMSLEEISRYVGYHSYAGFWKAWSKSR